MGANLRQSILKSFGRYIAIVLIIALGSALFVGLLMTKSDMVLTGQEFMDGQNMFDIRLVSTYGWDQDQVDRAKEERTSCRGSRHGNISDDGCCRLLRVWVRECLCLRRCRLLRKEHLFLL